MPLHLVHRANDLAHTTPMLEFDVDRTEMPPGRLRVVGAALMKTGVSLVAETQIMTVRVDNGHGVRNVRSFAGGGFLDVGPVGAVLRRAFADNSYASSYVPLHESTPQAFGSHTLHVSVGFPLGGGVTVHDHEIEQLLVLFDITP